MPHVLMMVPYGTLWYLMVPHGTSWYLAPSTSAEAGSASIQRRAEGICRSFDHNRVGTADSRSEGRSEHSQQVRAPPLTVYVTSERRLVDAGHFEWVTPD